jgi:hypothetical protein
VETSAFVPLELLNGACSGQFESHFTIQQSDECIGRLEALALRHGLKITHVVLESGLTPSQLMLTRHARGHVCDEAVAIAELVRVLRADGLTILRIKLEADPANVGIPEAGPGRYFEHHVKVLVRETDDLQRLVSVAEVHGARLSRNARRQRGDGGMERFVTQRCYGVDSDTSAENLRLLSDALTAAGFIVLRSIQELVLYDTNLALDAGWLETPIRNE